MHVRVFSVSALSTAFLFYSLLIHPRIYDLRFLGTEGVTKL